MLIRHATKTAIAAAILAGMFQHSDLAHIQYPIIGLIGTMLSSNLGDTIKASWGRLGGSAVGGIFAALLGNAFGFNPVTGGLSVIAVSLFCETYQWQALTPQSVVITALITGDPTLTNDEPLKFTFERILDTSIGVMVATLVNVLFWSDNPRQILSNNLIKVLHDGDRFFQAVVEKALRGESTVSETNVTLAQMSTIVQQSEDLLGKSMYGFVGKQLAQDNWSDLIATEYQLCRQLSAMAHTFKGKRQNQLLCQFTEELERLVEQVSTACNAMTLYLQTDSVATQTIQEILSLKDYLPKITDQIDQMRMTGEIKAYALEDILQVYNFVNLVTRFTQELDRLTIRLRDRQKTTAKTATQWSFKLHPIPVKQVKHVIKTGVAFGLTLAIANFAQLPLGYFAPFIVVAAMQPTLGKSIGVSRQNITSVAIGAIVAFILVNTLGSNPFSVGLGVWLTILICEYFGFAQGYLLGCLAVIDAAMMQGVQQSNPFIWGFFAETLLGVVIALIFSVLFWRETASQTLARQIPQTLVKLGTLYEIVVNYYLQGLDSKAATAQLSEEIGQSIQTQSLLQAETKQEPIYGFMVAKIQRQWNFLLSYEKTLLGNILSLQQATGQGDSVGISQFLHRELQASAHLSGLCFKDLAQAVDSRPARQHLAILLSSFDVIEQRIESQRTLNSSYQYELEDVLAFYSVLSTMREIALDLNQMAKDWPDT